MGGRGRGSTERTKPESAGFDWEGAFDQYKDLMNPMMKAGAYMSPFWAFGPAANFAKGFFPAAETAAETATPDAAPAAPATPMTPAGETDNLTTIPALSDLDRQKAMALFLRDKQYSNALMTATSPDEIEAVENARRRNLVNRSLSAPISLNQSWGNFLADKQRRAGMRQELSAMDTMEALRQQGSAAMAQAQAKAAGDMQTEMYKAAMGQIPTAKDLASMATDFAGVLPDTVGAADPQAQQFMNMLQLQQFMSQFNPDFRVPLNTMGMQSRMDPRDLEKAREGLQERFPDRNITMEDVIASMVSGEKY
jgi:hypothetical protein